MFCDDTVDARVWLKPKSPLGRQIIVLTWIMLLQMQEIGLKDSASCLSIKYIDCRNWFDFSEEVLVLVVSFVIFLQVNKHYRNLKKEKEDLAMSQHQKSVRRKIRVNLVQILYLFTFMLSTIYNMFLFMEYRTDRSFFSGSEWPQKIYKLSEILFVNWLNILNLTVSFLYWKATRAYYVLSDLEEPFLFKKCFNISFVGIFILILGTMASSAVFLLVLNGEHDLIFKIFTLLSTSLSILSCIGWRTLYRKHILSQIELPRRAVNREFVTSVLLFVSSLSRVIVCSLDILLENSLGQEWTSRIREQIEFGNGCIDTQPYYSIVLLVINLTANLLPAIIYARLFVSEIETRRVIFNQGKGEMLRKESDDW